MKINFGDSPAKGKPGARNSRAGKVEKPNMGANGAVRNENMGRSQAKGKPGVRNGRSGMVETPDTFSGKDYGGMKNKGDSAPTGKAKMGNPGYRSRPGSKVQKHAMFMPG